MSDWNCIDIKYHLKFFNSHAACSPASCALLSLPRAQSAYCVRLSQGCVCPSASSQQPAANCRLSTLTGARRTQTSHLCLWQGTHGRGKPVGNLLQTVSSPTQTQGTPRSIIHGSPTATTAAQAEQQLPSRRRSGSCRCSWQRSCRRTLRRCHREQARSTETRHEWQGSLGSQPTVAGDQGRAPRRRSRHCRHRRHCYSRGRPPSTGPSPQVSLFDCSSFVMSGGHDKQD